MVPVQLLIHFGDYDFENMVKLSKFNKITKILSQVSS